MPMGATATGPVSRGPIFTSTSTRVIVEGQPLPESQKVVPTLAAIRPAIAPGSVTAPLSENPKVDTAPVGRAAPVQRRVAMPNPAGRFSTGAMVTLLNIYDVLAALALSRWNARPVLNDIRGVNLV